ncbi:serine hydrolase domain-containing protein [uncultured Brevundimonas sp.]|mgnify:FL=1|uniref:serine hydrolase domain-containing protein n=1 Tax=uncultured Brevundimonas sp. TaxID=213418 RepID=UPI0030EC7D89|tara:strand:+ start:36552 stop:37670 length:1119 start_codon:yes stop_codon:yes gene_type:complete
MLTTRRVLMGGLAALPTLAALPAFARSDSGTADAALDAVFESTAPPALAAGIISREGLTWSGVRGVRRHGGSEPATLEDRWHLGSNTKAMTATVIARLVEQGRMRPDLTVGGAFPALSVDPAWTDVPLTALMHHRAGLMDADVIGLPWLMTARDDPRSLMEQRAAIAAQAFSRPPSGPVGTFAYGNANYIVVGAAIEAATGRSWEDAMRAEVFTPLGLGSAGFGPPPDPAPWGHTAGTTPMDPTSPFSDNPLALGPAGTVHMSLADYARFAQTFLTTGDDWLTPESIGWLTTPADGPPPGYADGWLTRTVPWAGIDGPGPILAHEGSNTFWQALILLAPQKGVGIIILCNDGRVGGAAVQALAERLVPIAAA